jgi:histidinol dehydrogenase
MNLATRTEATGGERRRLPRVSGTTLPSVDQQAVSPELSARVASIIDDVAREGEAAVRGWAARVGDLETPSSPLRVDAAGCRAALEALAPADRAVLQRTAARIEAFAVAHRRALADITVPVPGGTAGIRYQPVARAGCYAPGGRFPLPSSVLMTALTARAAGVEEVWVASPKPAPITLAAAAIAGAQGVLAVGGAQAIAAMTLGAGVPACDVIVGPGNAWVTEAKRQLAGQVRIDMLAGPSELLVVAGAGADPALVAADLLAQAEHDPQARPMVVTTSEAVAAGTERCIEAQLATLPTAAIAEVALAGGWCWVVKDEAALIAVADAVAPEHLALHGVDRDVEGRLRHAGAVFRGEMSAEVFADYGIGPNHVLPTGGRARAHGGLSVLDFLRPRAWLDVEPPADVIADAAALARLEGLEGHARAAELRGVRR